MSRLHLRRPSPGLILAVVALFVALGGGAYAATSSDKKTDKKIAKKAAKSYFKGHIGGASVSHANTANSATSATNATNATNANTLGGQSASAFESASKIVRFDVKASFGQTTPILTAGSLSLSLTCGQNSTDPLGHTTRDWGAIEIATTQNGALFDSGESSASGASSTDFLNTDTVEGSRVFQINSITTGTSDYSNDYDGGVAIAPDGSSVSLSNEGTGIGVNLLGSNCFANGYAVIES